MKKQFLLIAAGLAVTLIFFFGFSNKPPKKSVYSELSETLIDSLDIPGEEKILSLEKDLKKKSGVQKAGIYHELASEWIQANRLTIGGDYLRQAADADPSYENYMHAGTVLFDAMNTDTAQQMRMNVIYGARYCFEKAMDIKPEDTEAKIGLATVLVQGTNQPMDGILMLRKIDNEDPGNVKVNMVLGNFSIMSGQYDKAIERFTTVLEKDSLNLQARYLMAESYLGMQDTINAINTLEKGLKLAQDVEIAERIRQDINSLKLNKNI
ncbi:MAG: tetratricopeptide repeat protein [Fimbriimonadaceae bacterium]|nr:tetratricopeptide repeat protein [Chitinophagales bacterium]